MFTRDEVPFCAVCRRALGARDRPLLAVTAMSYRRGVALSGFARRHLGRMAAGRRAVEEHLAAPDQRAETLPMPTFVQLRVTNLCNLRCKMCGQWGDTGIFRSAVGRRPRPTAPWSARGSWS